MGVDSNLRPRVTVRRIAAKTARGRMAVREKRETDVAAKIATTTIRSRRCRFVARRRRRGARRWRSAFGVGKTGNRTRRMGFEPTTTRWRRRRRRAHPRRRSRARFDASSEPPRTTTRRRRRKPPRHLGCLPRQLGCLPRHLGCLPRRELERPRRARTSPRRRILLPNAMLFLRSVSRRRARLLLPPRRSIFPRRFVFPRGTRPWTWSARWKSARGVVTRRPSPDPTARRRGWCVARNETRGPARNRTQTTTPPPPPFADCDD